MAEKAGLIESFKRIPKHIGIIPDGNRRWAVNHKMEKHEGYSCGVEPGVKLCEQLLAYGVEEVTFYGFTKDNTNRPAIQTEAYTQACIQAVNAVANKDADILVIGKTDSKLFPEELMKYANQRVKFGKSLLKANFLVNYDWNWDLMQGCSSAQGTNTSKNILDRIASKEISRMDLIIRWGGRTRLSGFLPAQSVYSDFYVVNEYWPDFQEEHFLAALRWYQDCDVTLGG